MSLHDLRRLLLFAVGFALGVVVGHVSDRPLWQTIAVPTSAFLICSAAVDYVFADVRAYMRRHRHPHPAELPPAPDTGRRLDDDRPGWIKKGR